ncbi:MAG: hypothetical protein GY835_23310 [bacterium]|nr:hypothetical protein [bacterium]
MSELHADLEERDVPSSFGLIGVPDVSELVLTILDAESSIAERNETFEEDSLKEEDLAKVRDLVSLLPAGWIRYQKVAKLIVPTLIQDKSSGESRFLRRILIRIDFTVGDSGNSADESREAVAADAETFEEVLRETIANYDAAKKYRKRRRASPEPHHATAPAGPHLRITTRKEGIYRLSGRMIEKNAVVNLSAIEPATFKLFNLGKEVPIWVSVREEKVFDWEDTITFYATHPEEDFRHYTGENVFWLTWGGKEGKRMPTTEGDLGAPVFSVSSFKVRHHAEEDQEYVSPSLHSGGKGRWFWTRLAAEPGAPAKRYFVVGDVSGVDMLRPVRLQLSMRGLSDAPNTEKDHHAFISLNDQMIGEFNWSDRQELRVDEMLPARYLVEGNNIIKIELPGNRSPGPDQVLVDWFELDWWTTTAIKDVIEFRHGPSNLDGIHEFVCMGFKESAILAFDITNKTFITRIINSRIDAESAVTVTFQQDLPAGSEERTFLIIGESKLLTPEEIAIVRNAPDLRGRQSRADYIIITAEEFFPEIEKLASYREKQGLRTRVVSVENIYTEFSYGLFTPLAIRDFLKYAFEYWRSPSPSYVLLVGDATWDYRDRLGYGVKNLVPTHLLADSKGAESASDDWFVAVSGDDSLPDMHVGRLPVRSSREVENILDKILRYEASRGRAEWKKRVLLVTDDGRTMFQKHSEFVRGKLSTRGLDVTSIDLASLELPLDMPLDEKIAETNRRLSPSVIQEINRGCGVVHFVGHGGLRVWGHEHILNSRENVDHWEKMDNSDALPVVLSFSCLNNYFDSPRFRTIGERFLGADGKGAIAFAAHTRKSVASENLLLSLAIFDGMLRSKVSGLGPIVTLAKVRVLAASGEGARSVSSFTLLGDPALRVGLQEALRDGS